MPTGACAIVLKEAVMKQVIQCLAFLLLAALVSWGVCRSVATQPVVARESAFERVMRTNILRCAYIVYPPETIKDPNTGKLTGTIVETTEEVARQLGLQLEWTAEVGFQDKFEGLKTGRYDALCSGLREDPPFAKAALFSAPMMYGTTYAFVRAGDTRFDGTLDVVNDPNIKIAQLDGEAAQVIATENFPKASGLFLPPMSDISQVLESVAIRKADIAFLQSAPGQGFMKSNPGRLKMLRHKPVRIWSQPLMTFAHGEQDLKYIVDATLRTLHENGFVERTLRKYDPQLDSYLLVAAPYREK